MSLMPTQEEIIESLKRENKLLKQEVEMWKKIVEDMSKRDICTCKITEKGFARADEWIKCPVHGKTFTKAGVS